MSILFVTETERKMLRNFNILSCFYYIILTVLGYLGDRLKKMKLYKIKKKHKTILKFLVKKNNYLNIFEDFNFLLMMVLLKNIFDLVDTREFVASVQVVGGPTMAVIAKNCPSIVVEVEQIKIENAWNDKDLIIFLFLSLG